MLDSINKNYGLFTSYKDNWRTPIKLFNEYNYIYKFTLDPCSDEFNYLCKKHYTIKENGLIQSWNNEIVFMNPPYGREINLWIEKAYKENLYNNVLIVALLPARTDTKWFHNYIYKNPKVNIEFLKGRLHFSENKIPAPFPSMIVIFNKLGTTTTCPQ